MLCHRSGIWVENRLLLKQLFPDTRSVLQLTRRLYYNNLRVCLVIKREGWRVVPFIVDLEKLWLRSRVGSRSRSLREQPSHDLRYPEIFEESTVLYVGQNSWCLYVPVLRQGTGFIQIWYTKKYIVHNIRIFVYPIYSNIYII